MLILTDQSLAAAGTDFATAVALLSPSDEELVVHVEQCLEPDDGGHAVRHAPQHSCGSPADSDAIPTIPSTISTTAEHLSSEPGQCHSYGLERPAPTAGPMPEDLGQTFAKLEILAARQRLTLLSPTPGVYTLQGVLGQRHYLRLSQVHAALKSRRYNDGAVLT